MTSFHNFLLQKIVPSSVLIGYKLFHNKKSSSMLLNNLVVIREFYCTKKNPGLLRRLQVSGGVIIFKRFQK